MAKLKLDLHDIYNKGNLIDAELNRIVQEAIEKKIELVEIIPGVATLPDVAESADELLRAADTAMYQAKDAGKNAWRTYRRDRDASREMVSRLSWNDRIAHALAAWELSRCHRPKRLRVPMGRPVIGHGDLGRLATQGVAAARSTGGLDEVVTAQLAKELFQVGQRNLLALADGSEGDGTGVLAQGEVDGGLISLPRGLTRQPGLEPRGVREQMSERDLLASLARESREIA